MAGWPAQNAGQPEGYGLPLGDRLLRQVDAKFAFRM